MLFLPQPCLKTMFKIIIQKKKKKKERKEKETVKENVFHLIQDFAS